MVTRLKRQWEDRNHWFTLLLSSTHKGLKDHPKGEGWYKGYREVPSTLQQALDFYNGKEVSAWELLIELEKTALLIPNIWRVEIVIRCLRDPYNDDPSFDMDGYVMGLLIPFNEELPIMYFRLLAFKVLDWYGKHMIGWNLPYTIRLTADGNPKKKKYPNKPKRKRKKHAPKPYKQDLGPEKPKRT